LDELKYSSSEIRLEPGPPATSVVDEMKKYKELLDMDVITQDEFNAKKKQLLDL